MIAFSVKVVGRKKPVITSRPISLSLEKPTLRALISAIVHSEVEAFLQRQEDRKFIHVLTEEQITEGLLQGKIEAGGQAREDKVNVEEAVRTALEAFEDGLYLVFIDDNQIKELDSTLRINDNSEIIFLRLVALAGG